MPAHKLSWEEADRWIGELGTTWEHVLSLANVRTAASTLKMRWIRGATGDAKTGGPAPIDRSKVRSALEALERKKPTNFGRAMMALERWMDLGAKIAQMPEDFMVVTQHLERLAAVAEHAGSVQSTVEAARAAMADAMAPFRAPFRTQIPDVDSEQHARPATKVGSPSRDGTRKPSVPR